MSYNLAEISGHHEGHVPLLCMVPVSALAGLTEVAEPGLKVLGKHSAMD